MLNLTHVYKIINFMIVSRKGLCSGENEMFREGFRKEVAL